MADPTFLPQGGKVGLHCSHVYQEGTLSKAEKMLEGGRAVAAADMPLKEEDAVLTAVLSSSGLKAEALRLIRRGTEAIMS